MNYNIFNLCTLFAFFLFPPSLCRSSLFFFSLMVSLIFLCYFYSLFDSISRCSLCAINGREEAPINSHRRTVEMYCTWKRRKARIYVANAEELGHAAADVEECEYSLNARKTVGMHFPFTEKGDIVIAARMSCEYAINVFHSLSFRFTSSSGHRRRFVFIYKILFRVIVWLLASRCYRSRRRGRPNVYQ